MSQKQRLRRHCFTWNNYPNVENASLKDHTYYRVMEKSGILKEIYLDGPFIFRINESPKNIVKYICWSKEIAPETGTPHLQGYLELKEGKTGAYLRKNCFPAHFIACAGDADANIKYCKGEVDKKGDQLNPTFEEYGEVAKKRQGKRNDILAVRELVKNGGNMKDVVNSTDSFQAVRMAEVILRYNERKRNFKPRVYWYHGESGNGKTFKAKQTALFEGFVEDDIWYSDKGLRWWQDYDAHKVVIIDDFRKDFCKYHELLRILDETPYRVECKGNSRQFLAELIIITCPFPPEEVYDTREDLYQLQRRIQKVEKINHYSVTQKPLEPAS
jgi:hypothetical protein